MKRSTFLATAGLALALGAPAAIGQAFPATPIRMLVPFPVAKLNAPEIVKWARLARAVSIQPE
ncbi:MAG: hypothetical protein LH617_15595 [Ramlibacter sp.]|nr:hypothetical protein [Ramlibacter sp.]